MRISWILPSAALLCLSCSSQPGPQLASGAWRAWLDSPGGDLPFSFTIEHGEEVTAWMLNGDVREPVTRVTQEGTAVVFHLDNYGSIIECELSGDGRRLDGLWSRQSNPEAFLEMPFHAMAGEIPRFPSETQDASPPASSGNADGRWQIYFEHRPESPSVGVFETQAGGSVYGTILNVFGDYRYLEGVFRNGHLRLSRFDGAHAFLLDAQLVNDDRLEGRFWEGNYFSTQWVGKRDPDAKLPDTFARFEVSGAVNLDDLRLVDLDGGDCFLGDDRFAGKAMIIDIFGTWCPNCHDATEFLSGIYTRYRDRGLSVVGIGFEFGRDFEQNVERARKYRERHDVSYPLTLAFRDEARSPTDLFPTIQGQYVFPMIIILYGDGRVRAVHSGFTSRASRKDYLVQAGRFERIIEELLSEEG